MPGRGGFCALPAVISAETGRAMAPADAGKSEPKPAIKIGNFAYKFRYRIVTNPTSPPPAFIYKDLQECSLRAEWRNLCCCIHFWWETGWGVLSRGRPPRLAKRGAPPPRVHVFHGHVYAFGERVYAYRERVYAYREREYVFTERVYAYRERVYVFGERVYV
jgi:hypothetical protein